MCALRINGKATYQLSIGTVGITVGVEDGSGVCVIVVVGEGNGVVVIVGSNVGVAVGGISCPYSKAPVSHSLADKRPSPSKLRSKPRWSVNPSQSEEGLKSIAGL